MRCDGPQVPRTEPPPDPQQTRRQALEELEQYSDYFKKAVVHLRLRVDCAPNPAAESPPEECEGVGPQQAATRRSSGFLVRREDRTFLVTTVHSVERTLAQGNASVCYLGAQWYCLNILRLDKAVRWVEHPDQDVAVLRVAPAALSVPSLDFEVIDYDDLSTAGLPPHRAVPLSKIGFGLQLSAPMIDPTQQSSGGERFVKIKERPGLYFLVNGSTPEGASGGPVIDEKHGTCIGLQAVTVRDAAYTAVVPSKFVRETVDMAMELDPPESRIEPCWEAALPAASDITDQLSTP